MSNLEDFQTWVSNAEQQVLTWIKGEDAAIIEFFGPLIQQVKATALELGKEDLQVGLGILKDAAIQSVMAAALAPPGTQVAVAEATFLKVGATEGVTAIHNAEAGAIKAAVAIVQQQAVAALPPVAAAVVSSEAESVGDTIQKSLGG